MTALSNGPHVFVLGVQQLLFCMESCNFAKATANSIWGQADVSVSS